MSDELQQVADRVIERARECGHVGADDVRDELERAGRDAGLVNDVLALARSSLSYRDGKYHYAARHSDRVRADESQKRNVASAVDELLRQYQAGVLAAERRAQGRFDFVQPVRVTAEDGQTFTLLTRDLSATGMRLIGTRRLLGQRLRVMVPAASGEVEFVVRVLWTCAVGDDLVENGGAFVASIGERGA